MSDPATTPQNNQNPVGENNNDGGGGGGGNGGTEMQMDVPSNNNQQTSFSYQPRKINKINIPELEEEQGRMSNYLKVHEKALQDMDDDFITNFLSNKKQLVAAKADFEKRLVDLKEYGLTDEGLTTMKQVFSFPANEPEKIQGQQRLVEYAYANMNKAMEVEKKLNVALGEKRKADDEIALLKKNAAEFESNKKTKPNASYNAYQTYETSPISQKPNNNARSYASNNATPTNNNNNYDQTVVSNSKTTYEFPNASFNEKFTQKEVMKVTQDVNTVYMSSPAKGLFDLALLSHNNAKRNYT